MERWPPAYDAEDLRQSIANLARHHNDLRQDTPGADHGQNPFYGSYQSEASQCQGDIVRFESRIPIINEAGQPAALRNESPYWLLIGNTCDMARTLEDVRWVQAVPITDLGAPDQIEQSALSDLRAYRTSRFFYLPDWGGRAEARHFMAEFMSPVTVDKTFVFECETVARLSYSAWILLNACLVRFFARDDGRFDA